MPAIAVQNLTKKFKDFTAVSDLSFNVEENHVVGFLGPNGAGKTTTLRMLVGLSKPTKGEMTIADVPVLFGNSNSNQVVGYLPELPQFYNWMTGLEYLNFVADLFAVQEKDKVIADLLKLVELTDAKNKRISTYSGGMKQRLGIAQALVNDPEVIILDEPVSALDPIGRKEVLSVIEKLKKDKTVLFSTHILADVDRICDDIILINKGRLVIASSLPELKAKYAAPILEVEFTDAPKDLASEVKKQTWAKKVEANGNLLKVWLADESVLSENTPLKFFAGQRVGVLKYGLTLPETEDLFLELLEKHDA